MSKVEKLSSDVELSTLKELLHYDPETGIFTWRVSRGRLAKAGDRAGTIKELGYRGIKIRTRRYPASRLAWLYMTGRWPSNEMDHINGDRSDDRFSNLREATRFENVANRVFKPNTLGIRGVRLHSCGRYEARIGDRTLGLYATADEASAVRKRAEKLHFGDRGWFNRPPST